jgi:hypothetical protein
MWRTISQRALVEAADLKQGSLPPISGRRRKPLSKQEISQCVEADLGQLADSTE